MGRLQEGYQPTKTEVALFHEMNQAKPLRRGTPHGATGPRTYPLEEVGCTYTARTLLASQTRWVDATDNADGPTHVDLAVEGLLAALVEADQAKLRQRLLEHAAQVMLWAQELER
jgi:hypothetical protein